MLDLAFLLIIQEEELMELRPSRVTRTRIQVIDVIFSDFMIKGERNLVRVSGEFELSQFEL